MVERLKKTLLQFGNMENVMKLSSGREVEVVGN